MPQQHPIRVPPITAAQERLLLHAEHERDAHEFGTTQAAVALGGRLDVAALRERAARLVHALPELGSGFRRDEAGRPVRVTRTQARPPWTEHLVEAGDDLDAESRSAADVERRRGFDLTGTEPLVRVTLVTDPQGHRHRLIVTGHRAVLTARAMYDTVTVLLGGEVVSPLEPEQEAGPAARDAWRAALGEPGEACLIGQDGAGPRGTARLSLALPPDMALFDGPAKCLHQAIWGLVCTKLVNRRSALVGDGDDLPVRVDVAPEDTLRTVAHRTAERHGLVAPHRDVPLDIIAEATGFGEALFDTVVVTDTRRWDALGTPTNVVVENVELADATHHAMTVIVRGSGHGELAYRGDRVDHDTARTAAVMFERAMRAVAADPDVRVRDIDWLGAPLREQLIIAYNDTAATLPVRPLHQLFSERAAREPGAVAVVCDGRELSYAALDAAANRFANRLAGLGVRPGACVALYQSRSAELVVAELAVLKAGGTYVPLDPRQPAARLTWMVADAGAELLLTDREPGGLPFDCGVPVVRVPSAWEPGEPGKPEEAAAPDVAVHPDQVAYVMYTSGSTGTPKGVANTHRNVAELALDPCWDNGRHRRVLAYSPPTFDSSTYEMWVPLLHGGRMVVLTGDQLDLGELISTLAEREITALYLTTALFDVIAQESAAALAGVREIWTGGDILSVAALRRVLRECPDTTVVHVYGPTETTVFCSYQTFGPDRRTVDSLDLGRPMANTGMYVLDDALAPAAPGTAGELYVSGSHLARGYLGRPALTAERFIANPYGLPGSRLYRTGDVARWTHDGVIEFVGRADQQVKLRGFRIEPAEVETVLLADPGVRQAAVLVREDRPGDKRLVAYVVPGSDGRSGDDRQAEEDRLREAVAIALPEFMVPSAIVVLDALPLTVNGKLDRAALPAPDTTGGVGTRAAREPGEELLCGLFADVLGVHRVGVDDNFFHLGGHSLLATRLVGRIRAVFGVELSVRDVFRCPTVAGLAGSVTAGRRVLHRPLVPVVRPDRLPLSFAQQRLWFLAQMEGGSATYNIPLAIRLRGDLDRVALESALLDVLERHESLRTTFPLPAGEPGPAQRVLAIDDVPFELSRVAVPQNVLDATLAELGGHVFDLATEVPIRATLVETGPADRVLVLVVHHIASDGWSNGPLMRDLATAYEARLADGAAPRWSPLPVQYADYALWQRDLSGVEGGLLAFWRETLDGLPGEVTLPTDRPRPAVASYRGGRVEVGTGDGVHAKLVELAAGSAATLFMVVQAATAAVLARSGAGEDVPLGSPVAGRTDPALEDLVGFFVNTLVLRT
ncbi:amino acid adenylation domain-containing protein, partial [Polymorphospora rubra]|uniref:amino acid adenylation domain-containing protein n=1 Tax=Polymorphospora rubra TaxID=338584 RepID=UPI0033D50DC8